MFDWLKQKELAEAYVDAQVRQAAALERFVQLAELALGVDPVSLAKAAEAAAPPVGAVQYEADDQAFYNELKRIGEDLAVATGGIPSEEAILREYENRHGTTEA
jgi:hypothetical protein